MSTATPTRAAAPRVDLLDYLKGVLIVLVAWGHIIQFFIYKDDSFYSDPVFRAIYSFHMPLFMAISGFLFHRSAQTWTSLDIVGRRFRQLIVPVFCWTALFETAVVLFCMIRIPNYKPGWMSSYPRDIWSGAIFGFWFVWVLFEATVIMTGLKRFRVDNPAAGFAVFLILFLLPEFPHAYLLKFTFPFFAAGYFAAAKKSIFIPSRGTVILLYVTSILCYSFWTTNTFVYVSHMDLTAANLPVLGFRYFASAVISLSFVLLVRRAHLRKFNHAAFVFLGKHSLECYILQTLFFYLASKLSFRPPHPILISCTLAPVLGYCLCLASSHFARVLCRISPVGRIMFGRSWQQSPAQ